MGAKGGRLSRITLTSNNVARITNKQMDVIFNRSTKLQTFYFDDKFLMIYGQDIKDLMDNHEADRKINIDIFYRGIIIYGINNRLKNYFHLSERVFPTKYGWDVT